MTYSLLAIAAAAVERIARTLSGIASDAPQVAGVLASRSIHEESGEPLASFRIMLRHKGRISRVELCVLASTFEEDEVEHVLFDLIRKAMVESVKDKSCWRPEKW